MTSCRLETFVSIGDTFFILFDALMLDKNHLATIGARHKAYAAARHQVIQLASVAQGASKRAIFALHRADAGETTRLLDEAGEALRAIQQLATTTEGIDEEGSYRAALEEYAEAALYRDFVTTGKVSALADLPVTISDDAYLGGLSDLTGELQRRQVRAATEGRMEEVQRSKEVIGEIVETLLAMDLGGYLRTKFDQSRNSLRRAEEVLYEMTLRNRS